MTEPNLRYAVDGAVRALDDGDATEALLILRAAQRDADAIAYTCRVTPSEIGDWQYGAPAPWAPQERRDE